jgi:hypothetical protein
VWNQYVEKFRRGAQPLRPPGEEVIAALVARPRGWSQSLLIAAVRRHRTPNLYGHATLTFHIFSLNIRRVTWRVAGSSGRRQHLLSPVSTATIRCCF